MIFSGMDNDKLINRIRKFAKKHGLSDTQFCVEAVGNRNMMHRLLRGQTITLRTLERIEAYMRRAK